MNWAKMVEGFDLAYADKSYLGQRVTRGTYETEQTALVKSVLQPGWTFLDVGAGIGYYTMLAARLGCKVIAFEPTSSNRDLILKSADRNGFSNVEVLPFAVSDTAGIVDLIINPYNDGDNHIGTRPTTGWQKRKVRTVALDSYATSCPGRRTFIKVDVQGHELPVLRGGRGLIATRRPVMMVEDNSHSLTGAMPSELREELRAQNYVCREVAHRSEFCDLWCVPR